MPNEKHIVIFFYDRASIHSVGTFLEIFDLAMLEGGDELPFTYRVSIVSRDGGPIGCSFGATIATRSFEEVAAEPIDTLIIPGGRGFRETLSDQGTLDWITDRAAHVRRIASSGAGSFILASTGLLDGTRVATHFLLGEEFERRFPATRVDWDSLYIHEGRFWSSGGLGACFDFALALVEDDLGRGFAYRLARRGIVFLHRTGSHPQLSEVMKAQATEGAMFDRLHEWVYGNLAADLSVERLASQMGMSVRSFGRNYEKRMGHTPARSIMHIRANAAARMLSDTDIRISTIAEKCGFGDEQRMRRAFGRIFGVAPSVYRLNGSSNQK